MVMNPALKQAVLVLQLLAAGCVCLNHWSISLLRGVSPVFSQPVFNEPAVWGIVFLFVSSGFLTHSLRHSLFPADCGDLAGAAGFVCRRFWRLLLPVLAAVVFDKLVTGFTGLGPDSGWIRAAPLIVSLSQTWIYNLLGNASVPLPLGSSNMAWLGADLFFVAIVYALTRRLWERLSPRAALGWLCGLCLVYAAQFWMLSLAGAAIDAWAAARYGADVGAAYSFWSWLFEYCPYVHIASFLSGVVLAHWLSGPRQPGADAPLLLLGVVAIVLLVGTPLSPPRYLGASLLLLALLGLALPGKTGEAAGGPAIHPAWPSRLGSSAYELFVLHLAFYTLFTLVAVPKLSALAIVLLACRVVVASGMTLLLCAGLAELVFRPARGRINVWFGLEEIDDQFV